jgi:hypothetical protein
VVKGKLLFFNSYREGPALRVGEFLDAGQSNKCMTFGNPILTLGEKHKDDMFNIYKLEVFIL